MAECRITEAQIKEKALDVFELATKKHPELSRDHIYEDLDDKAMARCSYKVSHFFMSWKKCSFCTPLDFKELFGIRV